VAKALMALQARQVNSRLLGDTGTALDVPARAGTGAGMGTTAGAPGRGAYSGRWQRPHFPLVAASWVGKALMALHAGQITSTFIAAHSEEIVRHFLCSWASIKQFPV